MPPKPRSSGVHSHGSWLRDARDDPDPGTHAGLPHIHRLVLLGKDTELREYLLERKQRYAQQIEFAINQLGKKK